MILAAAIVSRRIADRLSAISVRAIRVSAIWIIVSASCRATIVPTGDISPLPWDSSTQAIIGFLEEGGLAVDSGSQVESYRGYLGYAAGGTGSVAIVGEGSSWTTSSTAYIGYEGNGNLIVDAGGNVVNHDAMLGTRSGATGTAIVSGSDSEWSSLVGLRVGNSGNGLLNVAAGGTVRSFTGIVGNGAGSIGNATIAGVGSTWINNSHLKIAIGGIGTLRVEDGGSVSNGVGILAGAPGGSASVVVSGLGSTWSNSSNLYVGQDGRGSLRVESGGLVSSFRSTIGSTGGAQGDATISGAGSIWTQINSLEVGVLGQGVLNISNSGLVVVGGGLSIDVYSSGQSYINMSSAGMLALRGNSGNSIAEYMSLIGGSDAIRYWNDALGDWTLITNAIYGDDYTLDFIATGDLVGYTLLTVLAAGPAGDFNGDATVDGADFLAWQRGNSPDPLSSDDLVAWQTNFGAPSSTPSTTAVPEPGAWVLANICASVFRRRSRGAVRNSRNLY